jgi:hypothetical protein
MHFPETNYNQHMLFDLFTRGAPAHDEEALHVAGSINQSLTRHLERIVSRLGPELEHRSAFAHARHARLPAIPDDVENIVSVKVADLISRRVPDPRGRRDLLLAQAQGMLPTITARVPSAEVLILAGKISSHLNAKLLHEAVKHGVLLAPERAVERLDPRIPEMTVRERQVLDSLTRNCVYDLPVLQQFVEVVSRGEKISLIQETLPNFLALFDFLEDREDPKWRSEVLARAQKMLDTAFLEGGMFGGKFDIENKIYERTL